jgi:glyoxylase-like metal-dependent hydrolase (beta-lactamase superfamily II)
MRITTERLAPGLHVFAGFANGNVLALETRDGVFLVDAQSAKRVAAFDTALRLVTTAPVKWVVNTHYHPDHTEGNAYYRARGAEVWAHRQVPVQAAKDTTIAALEWHRTPLDPAAMPTQLVDERKEWTLGEVRVLVRHYGAGHTDGDLITWVPAHNVLHIGDLFEVDAPPFVDWWAGGSLDGMIRVIDQVLTEVNDSTRIVPGHGAVSTRADLRRYREMLATVQERVRAGLTSGATEAALSASAVAGYEKSLGGEWKALQFAQQIILGLRR